MILFKIFSTANGDFNNVAFSSPNIFFLDIVISEFQPYCVTNKNSDFLKEPIKPHRVSRNFKFDSFKQRAHYTPKNVLLEKYI